MTAKHNFTAQQNATFGSDIIYKDASDVVVDLTGYTAEMDIRYGSKKGKLAIQLDTENGGITFYNGEIQIRMTAEQTLSLKAQPCYYDLLLKKNGTVWRILEGKFNVLEGVTKP